MTTTVTFTDANSNTVTLTDGTNYKVLRGERGRIMSNYKIIQRLVPFGQEAKFDFANTNPRLVVLPIGVIGSSNDDMLDKLEDLAQVFDPQIGEGTLAFTRGGVTRNLTCVYAGGLDKHKQDGVNQAKVNISFIASDPFWAADSATADTYEAAGGAATFFPFFPLTLSSSTIFASPTIIINGDVETWPVWTITGPGTNPVLKNLTTGKTTSLTITLLAGETLEIDTRPFIKTITKNDGSNQFSTLSATSSIWSLQKGTNSVQLELSGTTGDSQVAISYFERYHTH